MIWGNPWAWLGLAGVALPVLIHLLGRGQARVQRFPSLRFLDTSRLLPTRRTRLHDLLLLAVRVAILVAAVAAMAQPLVVTARRSQDLGGPLARAIIVDTSASMRRATSSGELGIDAARRRASQLRDSASTSVVLETADPASAIAGASAWLVAQPWRGELDIVSDFQIGAIDSIDLSAVPKRLGVGLSRIDVRTDSTVESILRVGSADIIADAAPHGAQTDVLWARRAQTAVAAPSVVRPIAAGDAGSRVSAAERAAAMVGVRLPVDTSRAIEVLYPGAPNAVTVLRGATTPHAAWMTTLVAKLRADSMLVQAAAHASVDVAASSQTGEAGAGLVVARMSSGAPIVDAVQTSEQSSAQPSGGRDTLVLVARADASSLVSAALIAAVTRAQSIAPAPAELDPTVLSESVLASWQRAPSPADAARANGNEGPSDARWLWALVLVLLAVEAVVRRQSAGRERATADVATPTAERSRVA
jgi:hypothetical protein